MQSPEINEIAKALTKAQLEIKEAPKDGNNPHFKSNYITLDGVYNAIRQAMADNGLSVVQTFDLPPAGFDICVVTTLMHTSGQWIKGSLPMTSQKKDPQGFGSAGTYARRYSLAAMLGVVSDVDDDGEGAVTRDAGNTKKKPPKNTPKAADYSLEIQDLMKKHNITPERARELTGCTTLTGLGDDDMFNALQDIKRAIQEGKV